MKRDDFRRVGYAYRSVLAELGCLDDICTVGVVYQAFRILVLDVVYEDRLVVQELAKGVTMGDVTEFPVLASSYLVFQLLPFSGFDEAICCGISSPGFW